MGQQRVELQKFIEAERLDRVREFRELREEIGGEREDRGQDRLSVKEALQAEVDARIADVRQLARCCPSVLLGMFPLLPVLPMLQVLGLGWGCYCHSRCKDSCTRI